jgi:8-oxo-dGTP pyrophosphatase MutT (NUDIX family)
MITNKKLYCVNCNKLTHTIKNCQEPIISYGVICFKFDDNLNISPYLFEKFLINKLIDVDEYNFSNLMNLNKIEYYKDKIKFLLIQRKHSFSYIEFIRGKYEETDINSILKLLNMMTKVEIESILKNEFIDLWNKLWGKTANNKAYQKEYIISQDKFNNIRSKYKLIELVNFEGLYKTPEWGFPKGRKDKNEKNIDCAIREFEEETGINKDKYLILNRLNTVDESVIGTNNITYKLIYYFGIALNEIELNTNDESYEVGDIKWMNFEEIILNIRPYFKDKIMMIYKSYFLLLNLIENICNTTNEVLNITE